MICFWFFDFMCEFSCSMLFSTAGQYSPKTGASEGDNDPLIPIAWVVVIAGVAVLIVILIIFILVVAKQSQKRR